MASKGVRLKLFAGLYLTIIGLIVVALVVPVIMIEKAALAERRAADAAKLAEASKAEITQVQAAVRSNSAQSARDTKVILGQLRRIEVQHKK